MVTVLLYGASIELCAASPARVVSSVPGLAKVLCSHSTDYSSVVPEVAAGGVAHAHSEYVCSFVRPCGSHFASGIYGKRRG